MAITIDDVVLPSGAHVTVRAIRPGDAGLQQAFFRTLSAGSRYSRFMSLIETVDDALAAQLSRVDQRSHVGLLAAISADGIETMIGEARYVVDSQDPGRCECAIAVADAWRGTGLARVLFRRLIRHA